MNDFFCFDILISQMGRTAKSQSPRRGRSANKAPRKAKSQSPRRRTSKSAAASAASKGKPRSSLKPVAFNKLSLADQDFIVNQLKPQKCLPGVSCRNEEVFCNKTLKPIIRRVLKIDPKNLTRDQMCDLLFEYRKLNQEIISARQKQSRLRTRLREKEEEREDLKRAKCRIAAQKNKDIRALNEQIAQLERDNRKLMREIKKSAGNQQEVDKLTKSLERRDKALRELRAERKRFIDAPTVNEVALKHAEKQIANREKEIKAVAAEEDHIKKEIVHVEVQKAKLEQEVQPVQEDLSSKEAELNQIERNRYALEERLEQLEREMEEKEVELRVAQFDKEQRPSKQQELRDEIERKKKILQILRAKRDKQDPEYYILHINRLEKVIRDKNNVIEESERRIKEIEKVFENQEKLAVEVVMDLKQELENAFRVRNNARSKLLAVETELESIRSENFGLLDQVSQMEREIRELKREAVKVAGLEQQVRDSEDAVTHVIKLREEVNSLDQKLNNANAAKQSLEGEYNRSQAEVAEKGRRINDLDDQVKKLQASLNRIKGEKEGLQTEKENLQRKTISIRNQTYSISDDASIDRIRAQIKALEDEIDKEKRKERELIDEIGNLYTEMKDSPKKYGILSNVDLAKLYRELYYREVLASELEKMLKTIVDGTTDEKNMVDAAIAAMKTAALSDAYSSDDVFASDPYYSLSYGGDPYDPTNDSNRTGKSIAEKLTTKAASLPSSSVSRVGDINLYPLNAYKSDAENALKKSSGKVSELSGVIGRLLADKVKIKELITRSNQSSNDRVKDLETKLKEAETKVGQAEQAKLTAEGKLADARAATQAAAQAAATQAAAQAAVQAVQSVPEPISDCDTELNALKSEIDIIRRNQSIVQQRIAVMLGRLLANTVRGANVKEELEKKKDVYEYYLNTLKALNNDNSTFKILEKLVNNKECTTLIPIYEKYGQNVNIEDSTQFDTNQELSIRFNRLEEYQKLRAMAYDLENEGKNKILSLFEDVVGIGRVYIRMFGNKINTSRFKRVDVPYAIPQESSGKITGEFIGVTQKIDTGSTANKVSLTFGPFTKVFHNDYQTQNPLSGTTWRKTNNKSIYEDSIRGVVQTNAEILKSSSRENPYNIIIMAYGQSGSGKTYTLNGNNTGESGITEMTLETILNCCDNKDITIKKLFIQLYLNYKGSSVFSGNLTRDFFVTPSSLPSKYEKDGVKVTLVENPDGSNNMNEVDNTKFDDFFQEEHKLTPNLTTNEYDIESRFEPFDISGNWREKLEKEVERVNKSRPTRSTTANPDSSRSHLFSIFKIEHGNKSFLLTIIDLGGNENTRENGNNPRLEEGRMINDSLIGIRSYLQRYGAGLDKEAIMSAKEYEVQTEGGIKKMFNQEGKQIDLNTKNVMSGFMGARKALYSIELNTNNEKQVRVTKHDELKQIFENKIIGIQTGKSGDVVSKVFMMMNTITNVEKQTQPNYNRTKVALYLHIHSHKVVAAQNTANLKKAENEMNDMIEKTTGVSPLIVLGQDTFIGPPGTLHLGSMILEAPIEKKALPPAPPATSSPRVTFDPSAQAGHSTPVKPPAALKPINTPRVGNNDDLVRLAEQARDDLRAIQGGIGGLLGGGY